MPPQRCRNVRSGEEIVSTNVEAAAQRTNALRRVD